MATLGTESFRSGTPTQTPEGNVVMNFSFDGYPLEEEELQSKKRQDSGMSITNDADNVSQPKDSYHGIYFAMLLAGVGFLLPYNSFITDVDYLHQKYPVLRKQRSVKQGAMVIKPFDYTAVVGGTAGVIISLSRIFTKLLLSDERKNTIVFFFISIGMEMMCFLLHLLVKRTQFVRYYTSQSSRGHECLEDKGHADQGPGYRVHHNVNTEEENGIVESPQSDGADQDIPATAAYMRFDAPKSKLRRNWPGFRDIILHRYVVARVIWPYMLSIALTYFITLCLFPGLESEIRNCTLGEWLPILIMAIFNLSDFVGKILAALPYDWKGVHLLIGSCTRVMFIPLFLLCVLPSDRPGFNHPAWPCVFSLLMGISNGYFGSVPMILAAGKVSPEQRELAGNTMTVSYMSGLTLGSAVAYVTYSLTSMSHTSCIHTETINASFSTGL
ncbi:equilibrative nucleoside transporter 4-like [Mustelus asterias]